MFPLWALSGLKFIKPALVDWPIYVNKEELTTVTLFYDAYYEFWNCRCISVFISIGSGCRMAFCKDIPGKKSGVVPILFSGSALILCSRFLQPGIPILRPGFTLW